MIIHLTTPLYEQYAIPEFCYVKPKLKTGGNSETQNPAETTKKESVVPEEAVKMFLENLKYFDNTTLSLVSKR